MPAFQKLPPKPALSEVERAELARGALKRNVPVFDVHSSQTKSFLWKYPAPMPWGLKRFHESRQLHFLTFSCYKRRANFHTVESQETFMFALERVRQEYGLCVYGYVVMPEHVHMLVSEPERGTLAQAMQSLKQGVARRLALRAKDSFWQARYYDFNVWGERKFIEKLRYIHRNPVTRGLVARPEDWQWSSFRHYLTGEAGPVEIESQWTARKREQKGLFPMVQVRQAANETPRPSGAWTGHPPE